MADDFVGRLAGTPHAGAVIWREADWAEAPDRVLQADRVLATVPDDAPVGAWLALAGQHGFCPVLDVDFGDCPARSILLARSSHPVEPALLAAAAELIAARNALAARENALQSASAAWAARVARHERAQAKAARERTDLLDRLQIAEASLAVARHERDLVLGSTMWRATGPLRRLLNFWPRRAAPMPDATTVSGGGLYQAWVRQTDTLTDADRAAIRAHIEEFSDPPLLSVVMPVYDPPDEFLRAAIVSVQAQLYEHWELCIADDASPSPHVAATLAEFAAADPRIRVVRLAANGNISASTNAALALARGSHVALMDHDDLLSEHALYYVAVELFAHPDADLIYSDEDHLSADGERTTPYFKPDWNLDLMLGHNMVSHLGVYRRALVERLGGMRLGYEGSQDYDLALRVATAAAPARIRHIPAVLYHWRQRTTSFSKEQLFACVAAARHAIGDALGDDANAEVLPAPSIPSWTRVKWAPPTPPPRVSVIVPTRDRADLLRRCAEGVLGRTAYPDVELIVVDNDSTEPATHTLLAELGQDARVKILPAPGAFNYAAMNNAAAAIATGKVLCLLNNDIEIVDGGWLAEMVSQAVRPGIGAVGAKLVYPSGAVQHAGVVLGVGTFAGGPGVAGHYSLGDMRGSFGYFGLSALAHEVCAVTAACMVLQRRHWNAAGGMDAANLPVAFNDVDLCLRLRRLGLRNLYTPFAELIHYESASRGDDLAPGHRVRFERECRFMRNRWGPVLDRDPFYNPNFSRIDGMFRLGTTAAPRPW